MIFIQILVYFMLLVGCSFGLSNDDVVTIIGGSHLFQGVINENGFFNQISDDLKKRYHGITVNYVAHKKLLMPEARRWLQSDIENVKPTIIVVMLGYDDIRENQSILPDVKNNLMGMVTQLQSINSIIFLCTPLPFGEKVDGSNELESELETWSNIIKRIGKIFGVTVIDTRYHFIEYLEKNNVENLRQAHLTYDGHNLNQNAHQLITSII